ncbi:hypothetical protein BaRGS_00008547 [Batillaria attramentaria]|uniref:Uncharacterized protein n=1 Tax=Batillaria attramentaria TaxID=370345 RepID=A0ABD0LLC5_9CAEN
MPDDRIKSRARGDCFCSLSLRVSVPPPPTLRFSSPDPRPLNLRPARRSGRDKSYTDGLAPDGISSRADERLGSKKHHSVTFRGIPNSYCSLRR